MDEIVVYVTTGSQTEAEKIATALVEQGLAACTNILPSVTSIFSWDGKICKEEESLMIIKSRRPLFDQLVSVVKQKHSYDVPEIIALPILFGAPDYLKWLRENTR